MCMRFCSTTSEAGAPASLLDAPDAGERQNPVGAAGKADARGLLLETQMFVRWDEYGQPGVVGNVPFTPG
jgi:hypothetical protein